jgi:thiol-disulfide isomerase/thioredoxin
LGDSILEGDTAANTEADEQSSSPWPLYALLVVAAAALVALQLRRPKPANEFVGLPLPTLEVAGWINSDRPLSAIDLRGQPVLIDFWATWCGPCHRDLPDLVRLNARYRDQGLRIVGLTRESNARGEIESYVESAGGVDWPIAHGAGLAFDQLGIEWLPTYLLYDRSGRAVWGGSDLDYAEEALVALLAKQESKLP